MKPYYEDGQVTLYHADALDVLADLDVAIDAVVTDPPYASGTRLEAAKTNTAKTMLRAGRFHDRPIDLDQMTTTGFVWLLRAIAMGTRPLLKDGGSFLCFIDWRQWPNLVGALETANLRVQGMVVWDKGHFGMGNGFRSQHELVCHASKGVPVIHDKGVGNVLAFPREEPVDHPSPKPEKLMQRLIGPVTPAGGLVLDPFAGSGTTLRAAKKRSSISIPMARRPSAIARSPLGGWRRTRSDSRTPHDALTRRGAGGLAGHLALGQRLGRLLRGPRAQGRSPPARGRSPERYRPRPVVGRGPGGRVSGAREAKDGASCADALKHPR